MCRLFRGWDSRIAAFPSRGKVPRRGGYGDYGMKDRWDEDRKLLIKGRNQSFTRFKVQG